VQDLIVLKGITKRFPGVLALDQVDLVVRKGEVHVLLGENGAGKSTLMKILAGAYQMDEGQIIIDGRPTDIPSPREGQRQGVSIIYQEFNLFPHLTAAQNIFLGREPARGLFIDNKTMNQEALKLLRSLKADIDPGELVVNLSVAEQQMVEIAKALSLKAKVLVMDEPTASLTERETEVLFETIRQLKARGVGIIYISHRLQEVFAIGDRATVLRDGQLVGTVNVADATIEELIGMMVGRTITHQDRPKSQGGREVLRTVGLTGRGIRNIDLVAYEGEIVGIAGLVGAGRTELARSIFGLDPITSGEIFLGGEKVQISSPEMAVKLGLALLPEDRKNQGLCLRLSYRENCTHAALKRIFPRGIINFGLEKDLALQFIKDLRIAIPNIERQVQFLSGGNQQKVVLAKWLCTKARIFIFDEPTRGIDVGAKAEIHLLMHRLTEEGAAIIMISSELPEILALSDRIYVMAQGKITAELSREGATQEGILTCATKG
jgi:ribose transport system ATP-binding protein